MSITDGLTGIKTRRFFLEAVQGEWKAATAGVRLEVALRGGPAAAEPAVQSNDVTVLPPPLPLSAQLPPGKWQSK